MRLNRPFFSGFKKLSPVIGIVLATLVIMFVLKLNPGFVNNVVEQQKSNIADFYKQNLKPLLYAADLSNEDIFNFAFYHRLPLDSQKKQFLQFGADSNGEQYFAIKPAGINQENNNNLAKFVKRLDLNTTQESQVDSILHSYAESLQSQVLVNEKNTVAINSNIWNYNKALIADLLSYAARANKSTFEKVVPPGNRVYNPSSVAKLVSEVRNTNANSYIFLTPDSIFSDHFQFDKDSFKKEMEKMKKELKSNSEDFAVEMKSFNFSIPFDSGWVKKLKREAANNNFRVSFDTNSCSVHLPGLIIPQIPMPDLNNLSKQIEEATKNFKEFTFEIPNTPGKSKRYNYKYHYTDTTNGVNYNFRAFGFDSLGANMNHPGVDSLFLKKFKNFSSNPDSLATFFRSFQGDSTSGFRSNQFQHQMKQLQQEMERFRKEMEQMQRQFQKNLPQQKQAQPSKSVEI